MRALEALRRLRYRALTALLDRWLRPTLLDTRMIAECDRPVVYVLPQRSLLDLMAVEVACRRAGLPSPRTRLDAGRFHAPRSFFFLARPDRLLLRRLPRRSVLLEQIVEAARAGETVATAPVSVFWSRAPARERSALRLLLAEDWAVAGRLRKLLALVFNRSMMFVRFDQPLAVEQVLGAEDGAELARRRLARLLRTRFRRHREALIGPDLSHRRNLVERVLATEAVTRAIQLRARETDEPVGRVRLRARRQAAEIASDLSFTVVHFFDLLLTRLWNRLYEGIEVHGIDRIKALAEDHTLIYVPSHRSHIDYLLLSYVLFYQGLMLPHIAAGQNLDLPVVGSLLRRGGAFFMRRSFRGDPVYATVFETYLDRMFARGFSVEYFVEGGRSRTGRLLPPKGGMLAMTLRSLLRAPDRPFAFVPVYFGYEKVIEARSYLGELRGHAKRKETLGGLLRSARFLRQSFGRVQVNFGEPLALQAFLDEAAPGWREERDAALAGETEWFAPAVGRLGERIQQRVNAAAAINPVSVAATAVLAAPRQAMGARALAARIDVLLDLARAVPPGPAASVTPLDGADVIAYCERLGVLTRERGPLGDVIAAGPVDPALLTWYRNNVQHLFVLPSLVAAVFSQPADHTHEAIHRICAIVYPFLRNELFLAAEPEALPGSVDRILDHLRCTGLLQRQGDHWRAPAPDRAAFARLYDLGRVVMPTLERYYIVIALIESRPAGVIDRSALEEGCVLIAQRMARLYGLDAPEFFDRTLFRRFIDTLLAQGWVEAEGGEIRSNGDLGRVLVEASRIISPDFRQGVNSIRHEPEVEAGLEAR